MHKTILIEEITIENVTEKINEKVQEMEKDGNEIKRRFEIFSVNLNLL